MPDVHFLGEISFVACEVPAASVTWAIVPGNNAWTVREGLNYGETQSAVVDEIQGLAIVSHPIDVHFQTSAVEGWPVFIFEVWDRTHAEVKGFHGCGCVWLPTRPGRHCVEVAVWRPKSEGWRGLVEQLVPSHPDITKIRELSMSPYLRSQYSCEQVGKLQVNVFVASSGFGYHGVQFGGEKKSIPRMVSSQADTIDAK
jgi:hypothetical protein